MPFEYNEFYVQLEQHLASLGDITPMNQAGGGSARTVVFQPGAFSASGTNVSAKFNEFCWAAHFNLSCIAYWVDPPTTTGNPVAITPRHVITSEHAHAYTGQSFVFLGFEDRYRYPTDTHVYTAVDNLTSVRADDIYDATLRADGGENQGGFRVLYLDKSLPDWVPVRVMLPSDVPVHEPTGAPGVLSVDEGLPMLIMDQFLQVWIQGLQTYSSLQGTINTDSVTRTQQIFPQVPGNRTYEGMLWRPAFAGDSGSPLFLMHRNQDFYYYGSQTQGQSAICVQVAYNNIVRACEILNDRHAARFGVPRYVPNSIFHDPRGPRVSYRPPPSGPLGP